MGFLCGGILATLLHPLTRPFFVAPASRQEQRALESNPLYAAKAKQAPKPTTHYLAAYWVQLVAQQTLIGNVTATVRKQTIELLKSMVNAEPDNAYWKQTLAAFQGLGESKDGQAMWASATRSLNWNDLQTERLRQLQSTLMAAGGRQFSWHFAAIGRDRLTQSTYLIGDYARRIWRDLPAPESDLEQRLTLLKNGVRLRDSARTTAESDIGRKIIESSSLKPGLGNSSFRVLYTARYDLINRLREHPEQQLSVELAQKSFTENDFWSATYDIERQSVFESRLTLASIFVSTIPLGLLIVVGIGLLFQLSSFLLSRFTWLTIPFSAKYAVITGVCIGITAYMLTDLLWFAMFQTAVISGITLRPKGTRSLRDIPLGPAIPFYSAIVGALLTILSCGYVASAGSAAAILRLTWLELVPEWLISSEQTAMIGIVLVEVFLLISYWVIWLRRLPMRRALLLSIAVFGRTLTVWGTLWVIIITPLCLLADNYLTTHLEKVAYNASQYYLRNTLE